MTVKITLKLLTYIILEKFTKADITGFIVGGSFSDLSDFPYSAFIHIKRGDKGTSCSGSILNQAFILTAGHCVTGSSGSHERRTKIKAYLGSVSKNKGFMRTVVSFRVHGYFNDFTLQSDIALLKLKNDLKLGSKVKRVLVMKNPPKADIAVVAGWGVFSDLGVASDVLRHTDQQILDKDTCNAIAKDMVGTICAREHRYPDKGDSGSALVINNKTIQVGLVSFKKMAYSNSTVVYTDVSFYEHWIVAEANVMYCEKELSKQKRKDRFKRIQKKKKHRKTTKPSCSLSLWT